MGSPKQLIDSKVVLNLSLTEIKKPIQEESFLEEMRINKKIDFKGRSNQEALWILTGIGIAVLLMLSVF